MIQGLWYLQVEAIIDVKLGGAGADSYYYEPTAALLAWWGNIKKYKHGKHCNNVLSVDGMLGMEALVVLVQLSRTMAAKREEPIFQVRGWVNGQIANAVAKSYSCMIHGDLLPSPLWEREPDWDPESGIGLVG